MPTSSKKSNTLIQLLKDSNGKEISAMQLVGQNPEAAAVISKLLISTAPTAGFDKQGKRNPDVTSPGLLKLQSDRVAQNINDSRTVMQVLPDIKHGGNILVSCILSPNDMLTTELSYTLPDDFLPSEITSAIVKVIRDYYETDYKITPLLEKILFSSLMETGSFPVAVLPENAIDDVINSPRQIRMEDLSNSFDHRGVAKPRGLIGPAKMILPVHETNGPGISLETFRPSGTLTNAMRKRDYAAEARMFVSYAGNKEFKTSEGKLLSLEDLPPVYVTDNLDLLKIPLISQKIQQNKVLESIDSRAYGDIHKSVLNGGFTAGGDMDVYNNFFRKGGVAFSPISIIKNQDQLNRRSVGEPLVQHFPSESVINVYVPGAPHRHVGHFVLHDSEGNPLMTSNATDYYSMLQSRMSSNGNFASAMIQKVGHNMNGFDWGTPENFNAAARLYGSMVERELVERLKNGNYGRTMGIGHVQDVYRLMLSRALSGQQTQLLFIPGELMTYFAFNYDEHGTGKSLLDDLRIINSMRSMLTFANTYAGVKNSIGRTEVKIKFDEDDPNPMKTIETIVHEITRTRQQSFPVGNNSPVDLADWVTRAGMEFTFEGHPGIPDVGVDFGEKSSSYAKPDTELMDQYRKQSLMGLGIPPEIVDNAFNPEFAVQVLTNNIMLTKYVIRLQCQFSPLLTDHLRKYAMHSEKLVTEIRKIIKSNIKAILAKMDYKDKMDSIKDQRASDGSMKIEIDPDTGEEKSDPLKAFLQKQEETKGPINTTPENERKVDYIVNNILHQVLLSFEVTLPSPAGVSLDNLMKEFQTYMDALDKVIDTFINSEMFTDTAMGDFSGSVDLLKATVKNEFLRRKIAQIGLLPEIAELVQKDENGKPKMNLYDAAFNHLKAITGSLAGFLKNVDVNKFAANIFTQQGLSQPPGGGSSGGSTDWGNTDNSQDNASGDGADQGEGDGGNEDDPFKDIDEAMSGLDDAGKDETGEDTGEKPVSDDSGKAEPAENAKTEEGSEKTE